MHGAQCNQFLMVIFVLMKLIIFALFLVQNVETIPYKNEKVAARLQLGCCYYAAIKYVCNNWWRQNSQLERLVACLQQPFSFYQRLQAHRATTRSQLQLVAVTSKKTARTHSL